MHIRLDLGKDPHNTVGEPQLHSHRADKRFCWVESAHKQLPLSSSTHAAKCLEALPIAVPTER